jgi:hypothetical protein
MSEKMDVRTAIRIAQIDVITRERVAEEIEDDETAGRAERKAAKELRENAAAQRVLIRIAQAFLIAGEE